MSEIEVEVYVNGRRVLVGEGSIETIEEDTVEMIVDTEDGPMIVQVNEQKFRNY